MLRIARGTTDTCDDTCRRRVSHAARIVVGVGRARRVARRLLCCAATRRELDVDVR
jgi:hypothetical protein